MWRQFQSIHKLDENIINTIENELKFDKITKVQNVVIPEFIKNKDVIVKACTGSGKTLAYLIPLFQRLINHINEYGEIKNKIMAVIMLPSRELSVQVFNIFLQFVTSFEEKYKFSFALLIGGKKIQKDLDKLNLEMPNIIIATPGRLFDLEEKLRLSFKDLQVLILDEADKMLELGYESKVTNLLEKFPKQRRTGLFSATVNSQLENLIKVGMRNPIFIDVKVNLFKTHEYEINDEIFVNDFNKNDMKSYYEIVELNSNKNIIDKSEEIYKFAQEVPNQLQQFYVMLDNIKFKLSNLINLIKFHSISKGKMMIFFATCNVVDYFSIVLPKYFEKENLEINFFKLHSKITQKKRKGEYKKFLNSKSGILLTTDLSSRGIDVPNVDYILQYDPPKNEEVYIHRVGRTARVGSVGKSILFISKTEDKFITYMNQKKIEMKPFEEIMSANEEEIFKTMKEINVSDKWIYEKAVKSFVSYIRFYSEHDLKYIFDVKLLDIGNLANSLCLFRLPRIKEILGKKVENFTQDDTVNVRDLTYVNTNTAKQMEIRDEKIKILKEERNNQRELRKLEFIARKDEKKKNRTRKEKKVAKNKITIKDWDDLAEDERLYKKYKKGKMSKEEYEKLLMKTS